MGLGEPAGWSSGFFPALTAGQMKALGRANVGSGQPEYGFRFALAFRGFCPNTLQIQKVIADESSSTRPILWARPVFERWSMRVSILRRMILVPHQQ